ncbi:hypothetical protein IWQ56_004288 [Coemansia nantahalensis]|uniref:Uncharacterized protein n=1 Tax=Coemansia nantahalensis TaxID=2789366 RepID=A0ACC1JXG1_9FUNG|nr:hypothetical protein IWQ56_004288 [Coemansia nantahalensis]KAJ2769162.1 hypothetical protein IWQ57_003223 [Coemansia nantahalensis]
MGWFQITHMFPARGKGSYLVTRELEQAMGSELRQYRVGMCNVFLQHTSASLCLNENVCPEVRQDLTMALDHMAPDSLNYKHDDEGPDDMPGHVKSAVMGVSLDIPIRDGRLALGTWQGIYLCEHRVHQHRRTVVITVQGEKRK